MRRRQADEFGEVAELKRTARERARRNGHVLGLFALRHNDETKANARDQRVVVEYKDAGGPEWWVMHADGQVEVWDTAGHALKEIKRRATKGNATVTVTHIEWRNTPDGFRPPQ
jgi:hypothetical protein